MPVYNTQFELTVDDIALIEHALQLRKSELSLKRLDLLNAPEVNSDTLAELEATLSDTHDLQGRLHNQKVFFRPETVKETPYIGG